MLFWKSIDVTGKWQGYRPTNGRMYEVRYSFEFRRNGSYIYVAKQVSLNKPFWTMQLVGKFRQLSADAEKWTSVLELLPDAGSVGPPSADAHFALRELLGLPDHLRGRFRMRKDSSGDGLTLQPVDADPRDSIDRGWYLQR
jgi:hypothetical protein